MTTSLTEEAELYALFLTLKALLIYVASMLKRQ